MAAPNNVLDENAEKFSISAKDPVLYNLMKQEKERQRSCIELIASENFTSRAVMECLGSCLTNKYSEGYPNARYYGGNEFIDQIEDLCCARALTAFGLSGDEWYVNVQPYSGSPANFAVYTALLNPHDRLMGLDVPSGGHLTHGFCTPKKKVSATSLYFESLAYTVDETTGLLDYENLRSLALKFRPKLIVAGISAYPRDLDYKRFREICDEVGAILMSDIAHVSGLVAAKEAPDPFLYSDVVTSTAHKTLRGPRAGIIFINKRRLPEGEQKLKDAVFPGLQGGPHDHQIAALAHQLLEVSTEEWKIYAMNVKINARALASTLSDCGHKLVTKGTDNHIVLWDLKPHNITGSKMQAICDEVGITLNKNAIHGDKSALAPSGVRLGTAAMTTRGLGIEEFKVVGEFLHKCCMLACKISESGGKKLVDFKPLIHADTEVQALCKERRSGSRHCISWNISRYYG